MGLFFSSAKTLKLSEIETIVKGITSLDYKEKERVIGAFATVADNNITKEEFRKVIHELYESHKIGEFDYKNLKKVWEKKY